MFVRFNLVSIIATVFLLLIAMNYNQVRCENDLDDIIKTMKTKSPSVLNLVEPGRPTVETRLAVDVPNNMCGNDELFSDGKCRKNSND